VRSALTAVAEWMLRRHAQDPTTIRLSLFCGLEHHDLSQRLFEQFAASYFEALADYLRQQMRRGVLRTLDPLMTARSFVGAVVYHSLLRELFNSVDSVRNLDAGGTSKLVVSIWLDGMSATGTQGEADHPAEDQARNTAILLETTQGS